MVNCILICETGKCCMCVCVFRIDAMREKEKKRGKSIKVFVLHEVEVVVVGQKRL